MLRKSPLALLLLVCATVADARSPSRQKFSKEITIPAPATKVWAAISDYCAIGDWHPAIYQCSGIGGNEPGSTRTLTVGAEGGPEIEEGLQKFDAEKMTYKYKITKTDNTVLPVISYSSFLAVAGNDDGSSTVTWRSEFYRAYPNNNPPSELNDDASVTAVTNIYESGLQGIKKFVEE